jgi:hypothetical protein
MVSVEIRTPISMNEHFSIMAYLLVRSLHRNAGLPGDWRVVFTVSRDSVLGPDAPQFRWAKDFPVEFEWVEQRLWDEMGHVGTGTQCMLSEHTADVVLYMDADVVVRGSLSELVHRVARSNAVHGWPAWFSGNAPFDEIFRAAGIESPVPFRLILTDEGADIRDPGWPFYFNFGFIGVPRDLANRMRETFLVDQAFVAQRYPNYFSGQVALALNIARNKYACEPIDERYNVGSDHPVALEHYEKTLGRQMIPSAPAIHDPRVLHYCFPTPSLDKRRDMATWGSLMAFLDSPGLAGFEYDLQETIRRLDLRNLNDEYSRQLPIAQKSAGSQQGATHKPFSSSLRALHRLVGRWVDLRRDR